jgi:dTDP-4-amino-4,6-dideoxygalactose transaminase
MKYIEKWTESRRKAADLYTKTFESLGLKQVVTPYHADYVKPVYHLYIVRVQNREQLMKYLSDNGIQTGLHYPIPLHEQRAYAHMGYKPQDFPVASRQAKEILSLPMYPEIKDEMVYYVCEKIKEFYNR